MVKMHIKDGELVEMTAEEEAAFDADTSVFAKNDVSNNLEQLRSERNRLLAETDYWDASDTPDMTQAQIDYRQALRDITETYSSLDDVIWPVKPQE